MSMCFAMSRKREGALDKAIPVNSGITILEFTGLACDLARIYLNCADFFRLGGRLQRSSSILDFVQFRKKR